MATLTNEVLQKSSLDRFIAAANYKAATFLILVEDDVALGLKENAEVIDVKPIKNQAPITARVSFRIDRAANGIPFNEPALKKRYMERTISITQVSASTIAKEFGINGTIYLALTTVPATTKLLAARLNELYNLNIAQSDIEDEIIPANAEGILLRFAQKSVGFTGMLRVDLKTPITNGGGGGLV